MLHAIGYADGPNLYEKLYNQAVGMVILACAGSIPGYWAAVFTIDTFGRKPLQIGGFLLLTILFCILGFMLNELSQMAMLGLYVVGQFLFNAGPNTTTFIVAGECFPTRYRSTAHGISAAMGKLGAVIAQVISIPLLRKHSPETCVGNECSPNLDRLLQLFALFMLLGTLTSLLIPETKGLTLEELSGETRTSYNAGCNGSISLGSPRLRAWNPFHGGQPAGFFYPRTGAASISKGTRSNRVGIMTPPGSPGPVRRRKPQFWRRKKRSRGGSDTSNDIALSICNSRSGESQHTASGEMFGASGPAPATAPVSPEAVPTWGAGWGRIDKGRRAPGLNEVQLHDVGSLLQNNS